MQYPLKNSIAATLRKSAGIVALLFFSIGMQAQAYYTNNGKYLRVKTDQNNLLSAYRYTYPDTNVTQLNNFAPRNFMGNLGLPSPSYFFNYGTDDLGFHFFNAPTTLDRIEENQVEYYRTKGPYANLTGIAGSKLLQSFKMIFTHTYKDKVNFTLRFNRYSSQGFYLRQQSYANNFFFSSNYTSKRRNWGYYFFVLSNGNRNQENGGIKDGQLNDSTVSISKDLLPVRITGATRDNRETRIVLNPWWRVIAAKDSLHGFNHYLQLKSRLAFNSYQYRDANIINDAYYPVFYLDTVQTTDSANVKQLSNEINYTVLSANDQLGFSAGYKNEITQVWQKNSSQFENNLLNAGLVYRTRLAVKDTNMRDRNFETRLNASYVFAGYNSGNYKAESNSFFIFDPRHGHNVYFNLLYERRSPDRIYSNWYSNHFIWQNNFDPQSQLQAKLGVNIGRHINAWAFYQTIYNYLYFNEQALPAQHNGGLANTGASIAYTQVFFKHLGLLVNYVFQNTSGKQYVRVPQNSYTAKLFYTGNLFRNNLQLQIGGQVQMYQSFYSYAYMPATQVFYLQNGFQTAAFPFVDVYLNARIRPVTFFLKMENALAKGVAGNNYAFVPGYYQPERAFRFGISWTFFD